MQWQYFINIYYNKISSWYFEMVNFRQHKELLFVSGYRIYMSVYIPLILVTSDIHACWFQMKSLATTWIFLRKHAIRLHMIWYCPKKRLHIALTLATLEHACSYSGVQHFLLLLLCVWPRSNKRTTQEYLKIMLSSPPHAYAASSSPWTLYRQ